MPTNPTVDDVEFGACVCVVHMPNQNIDRFYGPFACESDARDWARSQSGHPHVTIGVMPLRRTDIDRTYDDFFNPLLDWDSKDFWEVKVRDVPSD